MTVVEGRRILAADLAGTLVFVATAVLATVFPGPLVIVSVSVALALFAVGCAVFLVAFLTAVGRSRYDDIATTELFFLVGSVAPPEVRRRLWTLLAVQIVVAVATSSIRPFTSIAFGILAPMFGLAMMGFWGARHGSFRTRRATQG